MKIPNEVKNILYKLQSADFEAYAVGGCVRDLLLNREPKDWDVCTNALPEQIQQIFPDSFYENKFGTVTVKAISDNNIQHCHPESPAGGKGSPARLARLDSARLAEARAKRANAGPAMAGRFFGLRLQNDKSSLIEFVEVTTYRVDAKYTNKRHPDSVSFTRNLTEDLARRDFTINAMALRFRSRQALEIIDPFGGQKDLDMGLIRAVGEPDKRFNEDALRMLRAVRLVVELPFFDCHPESSTGGEGSKKDFSLRSRSVQNDKDGCSFMIEEKTREAIKKNAVWLQAIAKERVRDEFVKIIMSERPDEGILLLQKLGLLGYVIPEIVKGIGVAQNKHHIYTIFEHGIFSLKFAAQKKFNLVVRLAALLHDVAKPQAKRGEGPDATFYNHDIMGARLAVRILDRLRFDNDTIERVANLIRHHMFVYDIGVVTPAGVRRLLAHAGPANMADLLALRISDRLGSGVPKAQPYRLRHFQYMVAKVQHDAISVKMLKINGNDLMKVLNIKPGPKIGAILDVLLAEVIEDPKKNDKNLLAERVKQLNDVDLTQLRQMAKERIEEEKEEEDKIIKEKYWVK